MSWTENWHIFLSYNWHISIVFTFAGAGVRPADIQLLLHVCVHTRSHDENNCAGVHTVHERQVNFKAMIYSYRCSQQEGCFFFSAIIPYIVWVLQFP